MTTELPLSAQLSRARGESRALSRHLVAVIEERWAKRFGAATIRTLRASLERVAGSAGLQPYPDGS
jgi:hypothetical protein